MKRKKRNRVYQPVRRERKVIVIPGGVDNYTLDETLSDTWVVPLSLQQKLNTSATREWRLSLARFLVFDDTLCKEVV